MIIYMIVCSASGDCYVGQTRFCHERRFRRHLSRARNGSQTHLHRAIRFYGESTFSVKVLEEVSSGDLNERERCWIASLKPAYNMTEGGEGGDTSHSPAYKRGMAARDIRGSNNPMWGRRGEQNPNKGKRRSAEQRETQKNSFLQAWAGNEKRRALASARVSGFSCNPGAQKMAKSVVFEGVRYISLAEAHRKTGRSIQTIKKHGVFDERQIVDGGLPPQNSG